MNEKVSYSKKGLFATSNITVGETIYEVNATFVPFNTILEQLHSNGYPHAVSHCVVFTPTQMEGCPPILKGLLEKKRKVVMGKVGKRSVPSLYLQYALTLRSHGFRTNEDWYIDDAIHYVNRSANGNLQYYFDGEKFKIVTFQYIEKGAECTLEVEGLNNYWSMLNYGRLISNPYLDVYLGTMELEQSMRSNLDYTKFNDKFEYQLMYQYNGGTLELFSLFRFLVNENESPENCPSTLTHYRYPVKDLLVEVATLRALKKAFGKITFDTKSNNKFKEFIKTEENIVKRWLTIINDACFVLEASNFTQAKKRYKKLPCEEYHQQVVSLFIKKKYYN